MIGPFPEPVHGISISNNLIYKLLSMEYPVTIINTSFGPEIEDFSVQGKFKIKKIINSASMIFKGIGRVLFRQCDVVYITPGQSFWGFMRYSPFIICSSISGVNSLIHIHGANFKNMYRIQDERKKRILRYVLNRASAAIVLGDSLVNMLSDLMDPNKIHVCMNGVDDKFIASEDQINQKINKPDSVINVLFLSNLMREKGILDFLDSLKYVKDGNMHFHIAGQFEQSIKDIVLQKMEKYKNALSYHGVVSGELKKQLLLDADILCLPTTHENEGQPICILEAMACGAGIVATRNGGIVDIVEENKNGFFCKMNDPKSIYEALINSYEVRKKLIIQNYKDIQADHTEEIYVKRILEIMESC